MAKHACPSCGKRFDFEKNGWICPYCGSVVLHSVEQTVYVQEQQAQKQKEQKKKKNVETLGETLRRRVRLAAQVIFVVCVILFGGTVFQKWKILVQLKQSDVSELTEQTQQCGASFAVFPYVVTITGAQWTEELPDFPKEVKSPSGGRYLAVSFTCESFSQSSGEAENVAADTLMWTCLDVGDGYLLPQYPSNLTGSDTIQTLLYDLGTGYQLDRNSSMLVFLVDEDVQIDRLALRIYTGEPAEHMDMSDNNAQTCYRIPLEVIS